MKKFVFFFALVIILLSLGLNANATIRRVGYFGPNVSGTDFGDLQSAITASNAGDTTYIYPGSWSATVSKRLVLIGYGYFGYGTNPNIGLQNIVGALVVNITLTTGADSSIFEGIDGLSLGVSNGNTNYITINRCNCSIGGRGFTQNKWTIKQSYITNITFICCGSSAFTNLVVQNSYLLNFNLALTISGGNSGILNNNIFEGNIDFNNSTFNLKNNVFISARKNDAACVYQYNIATTANPLSNTGNNTNNINVSDISTVFVGYPTQGTYSNDERFTLKSGSPAIGAGQGGTDCGIYGGSDPYHLSGIPPIPAFYKLTAPSTTTSGNPYTITFSVRSNN